MISIQTLNIFLLGLGVYLVYRLSQKKTTRLPLPPGPKGLPLLGNLYDVPADEQWVTYKRMADEYGSDLVHVNLFGNTIIAVNSFKAAEELFERRGAIYADRPRFAMIIEFLGFTWNMAFMRYGEGLKARRALFRKELHPRNPGEYRSHIIEATRALQQRLLAKPAAYYDAIRYMAAKSILSIAYGIDIQPENDPYVDIVERAMHTIAVSGFSISTYLMDAFPWIQKIPSWAPGGGFKVKARELRKPVDAVAGVTLDYVKRAMADGTARPSVASKNLQKMEDEKNWTPQKELILSDVLASMYAAGADTTVSAMATFLLAMVQNPEIQKKGQAAVDAVVGTDRLPTFEDRDSIPYVDAIMKEVLRWKPVTPLAVSHSNNIDDEYDGYFIPKGSVIVANAWAMLYDETVYGPETHRFNPDRFMKGDALNKEIPHPDAAFGFGRRICAGQHVAESSMWISIASVLSTFNINKALDERGDPITPPGDYASGLVIHALPFECDIQPRSKQAEELIRTAV